MGDAPGNFRPSRMQIAITGFSKTTAIQSAEPYGRLSFRTPTVI